MESPTSTVAVLGQGLPGKASLSQAETIAEVAIDPRQVLRLQLGTFEGERFVNVRTWVRGKRSGRLSPPYRGMTLPAAVAEALAEATGRLAEAVARRSPQSAA
jgi:Transcriptional Coactivator p15 (PC4)